MCVTINFPAIFFASSNVFRPYYCTYNYAAIFYFICKVYQIFGINRCCKFLESLKIRTDKGRNTEKPDERFAR